MAAFGLFAKSQHDKGMLEQKVKGLTQKIDDDISRRLHDHDLSIIEHTATLAQHEGSFKVIDTKLDYIKEAVDKVCK